MRSEEEQVRTLLGLAAELPDEVNPPIARLIKTGHHNRARRTVLGAVTAAVVVAAAAVAPSLAANLHLGGGAGGGVTASGPSAVQLAGYSWSKLPRSPLGRSELSITAWTGKELLEIGYEGNGSASTRSAAYDPGAGHWRVIAPEPLAIDPQSAKTLWTGRQLLIAGTLSSCAIKAPGNCVPQVELYDPVANRWSTTQLPSSLGQRGKLLPSAVTWTGSQVVVAGGYSTQGKLGVASYNPVTGKWQVITPTLAAGHPVMLAGLAFVHHRLILWSAWDQQSLRGGTPNRAGTDVFSRSEAGAWSKATAGWSQARSVWAPVLTRNGLLVAPFGLGLRPHGFFIDPDTLAVTDISPGPLGGTAPAFSWTGRAVLAVDAGNTAGKITPGAAADYDPATRAWHSLPSAAGLFPTKGFPGFAASPVWAGTQLLGLTRDGGLLAFHR